MQEGQRVRDIHEPGHRYLPRAVQPRLFRDVVSRRPSQPQATPVMPVAEPQHLSTPSAQQSVSPLSPHKQTIKTTLPRLSAPKTAPDQQTSAKPALPRQNRSMVLRRRIQDSAKRHKKSLRAERQRTAMAFVFGTIAASALFVGGFLIYVNDFRDAPTASKPAAVATLGVNTGAILRETDETSVSKQQVAEYTTDDTKPRVLRIPRIGVESRVREVEAGLNGEPVPTPSIYDVGWLTTTPVAGAKGVTVMNGSKVGPTKNGIFSSIDSLHVGDEIQVELGNGKVFKYEVVGSKQFDAGEVDMGVVGTPGIAGATGMNLLTNTGRFNVKTNRFEPRTLIMTVLRG